MVIFSKKNIDLATSLQQVAIKNSWTLATAESCTGGLIGGLLTGVSGSSAYYLGGIISYSNQAKISLLGVKQQTLQTFGAVSEETAMEMLIGIQSTFHSDVGVSITGIAGPSGGSEAKPVGTVWVGIKTPQIKQCFLFNFHGDRNKIRQDAINSTLELLIQNLS